MQVTTLRSVLSVNWSIILRWGSQGFVRVLIVAACFAYTAKADPGDLDNSFGDGGIVFTDFGGTQQVANAIAIQSDGKIVAAGAAGSSIESGFALTRYNTDGSLDNSFGVEGLVLTDFDGRGDSANAIAIQSDGSAPEALEMVSLISQAA